MPDDTPGEDTIQGKLAICSFTVKGTRFAFPVLADDLAGGNRIVAHKRPYRQGAKLDSTGSEPDSYSFKAIFNNSIDEPGLDETRALYPDILNDLIRLFKAQETGDLMSPLDGLKRVRASSWKRSQPEETVDTAFLEVTFTEDNEDSFSKPGVQGSLIRLAEITVFTAEQEGLWNENFVSLGEFAAELEGLIRFPGEYANAIVAQQRLMQSTMRSILNTARQEDQANLALLEETPVRSISSLLRMADVVAFALEEKHDNRPASVDYLVRTQTNITELAGDVQQPADALLELNEQRIEDPLAIEPGWYKVYRSWP